MDMSPIAERPRIESPSNSGMSPIEALRRDVSGFASLEHHVSGSSSELLFHRVVSAIHQLCLRIADCENTGVAREDILRVLDPAREIHARSALISRLQNWPRGYPGDFETIEYLSSEARREAARTVEGACEYYAITCAAAQQHRNKIRHQADILRQTIASIPSARILILACGGCPDVELAVGSPIEGEFELVLNDADADALSYARRRLAHIQEHISERKSDVLRLLRQHASLGTFDLIVAGGLFDYLSDKQVVCILRTAMCGLLRPRGRFFFTNIAHRNPYRLWMSYLADWHLVERSPTDINRLAIEAGVRESPEVRYDQSGLALLVTIAARDGSGSDKKAASVKTWSVPGL